MAKPPVPKTGASRALAVAICWYNFVVVWFGSVFVLFLGFRGGVGRGDVGSRIVVTAGVMLNALALCARTCYPDYLKHETLPSLASLKDETRNFLALF